MNHFCGVGHPRISLFAFLRSRSVNLRVDRPPVPPAGAKAKGQPLVRNPDTGPGTGNDKAGVRRFGPASLPPTPADKGPVPASLAGERDRVLHAFAQFMQGLGL